MQTLKNRRHPLVRRAFSLIEVMIVIAIILAISGLVAINLFSRKDEATAQLAEVDMNTLKNALKQFRLDYDRWPTDEEGLEVLWNKEVLDPDADQDTWRRYLEEPMAEDRWGNEWGYRQVTEFGEDESVFDLWSWGPDGEDGTEDDITSWDEDEDGFGGGLEPTGSGG